MNLVQVGLESGESDKQLEAEVTLEHFVLEVGPDVLQKLGPIGTRLGAKYASHNWLIQRCWMLEIYFIIKD